MEGMMENTKWDDKESVLRILRIDGDCLRFVDPVLRRDMDVILTAVSQDSRAFSCVDPDLKKNKEVVTAVLDTNGYALEYVDEEFKNDKDMVMRAIQNKGRALQFASPELRDDKDIVLEAINRTSGYALADAGPDCKNDPEIVKQAVSKTGATIEYANPELLQTNRNIILTAVRNGGSEAFSMMPEIGGDKEILLEGLKGCSIDVLNFADVRLLDDVEFMKEAIKIDDKAILHASPRVRNEIDAENKKNHQDLEENDIDSKSVEELARYSDNLDGRIEDIRGELEDTKSRVQDKEEQVRQKLVQDIKNKIATLASLEKELAELREKESMIDRVSTSYRNDSHEEK